jgi:hypothetical protein
MSMKAVYAGAVRSSDCWNDAIQSNDITYSGSVAIAAIPITH